MGAAMRSFRMDKRSAQDLSDRLVAIWLPGPDGRRPAYGGVELLQTDPAWRSNLLFFEYFNGDDGAGLGASHQTGWTGLLAHLVMRRYQKDIQPRTGLDSGKKPALIDEIASNPKIATYFDLSLQHASVELLRAMRRPGGAERYVELLDQIRSAAPEAATRSSFIVGFPGETEAQVEELAEFLEAAELDWAGFFPYSPVKFNLPPMEVSTKRLPWCSALFCTQ